MKMVQIVLIALALSMDAFAVSVSAGICIDNLKWRYIFRGSFSFGLFQFLMPLIGWMGGTFFRTWIQAYDHWIAFGLLVFIGGRMLWESKKLSPTHCDDLSQNAPPDTGAEKNDTGMQVLSSEDSDVVRSKHLDIRNLHTLLVLSVATSIDALAVGFSLSFFEYSILNCTVIIGGITMAVCLIGFEFGKRMGHLIEKRAELFGGLILIGIGIKILIEHLGR